MFLQQNTLHSFDSIFPLFQQKSPKIQDFSSFSYSLSCPKNQHDIEYSYHENTISCESLSIIRQRKGIFNRYFHKFPEGENSADGLRLPRLSSPLQKARRRQGKSSIFHAIFHEIKIRQNAYCILGKHENEVLRNFSSIFFEKGKSELKTDVMG